MKIAVCIAKFHPGTTGQYVANALSRLGFNVNSFFGSPVSYDVNMRVFETLSCGLPIVTNYVKSLTRIFPENAPYILTYNSLESIVPTISSALGNENFLTNGNEARAFILENATYEIRMEQALIELAEQGIVTTQNNRPNNNFLRT